jgi:hypothetical protein
MGEGAGRRSDCSGGGRLVRGGQTVDGEQEEGTGREELISQRSGQKCDDRRRQCCRSIGWRRCGPARTHLWAAELVSLSLIAFSATTSRSFCLKVFIRPSNQTILHASERSASARRIERGHDAPERELGGERREVQRQARKQHFGDLSIGQDRSTMKRQQLL